MGERFGGAIDGWLPQSDCADVLPALPAFDRLVAAARGVQPVCLGTIRFSLGQDYRLTLTALRLHRLADARQRDLENLEFVRWSSNPHWAPKTPAEETRFLTRRRALVDAAKTELANYYAAYFGASPGQARRDATVAASLAVAGAYHLCE